MPVKGPAGPAKQGAAAAHGADDDFAAMMRDAQGAGEGTPDAAAADAKGQSAGTGDTTGKGAPANDTTIDAVPDSTGATDATDATAATDPLQAHERAATTRNVANVAGFFRSLRQNGGGEDTRATAKAPAQDAPAAETPAATADDPQAVPVIVVVQDIAVTPHALPGLGSADAQGVEDGATEQDPATASTPAISYVSSSGSPAAPMPDGAAVAPATPELPVALTATDPQVTPPQVAAPAVALSPELAAALAAAAPQAPRLEIELPLTPAAPDEPAAPNAFSAQGGTLSAQARELINSLSAASTDTPQTPGAASPVFARPRAIALTVDGTDKSAAPKIKITMGTGDVALPRAERMSVTPRVLSPVLVVPHAVVTPATAASVTAEITAATLVEARVTDQIVQSLRMQWVKGGGEATIELNPNGLGKVQVQVRVDRGAVSASVQAETAVVREFISSRRNELAQTLQQQGMRLEKLEVAEVAKEQPTRDNGRESRQSPREAARQRRDERGRQTDTFELNDPQENV